MRAFSSWIYYLIATTITVIIAYLWLDRPLALLMHQTVRHHAYEILTLPTRIPDPLVPLATLVVIAVGLRAVIVARLLKYEITAMLCGVSVIVGETIKNELKYIFGRTWPETWIDNNPSFIHDGVYGFHFMHGGSGYRSFPSGHMTAICALIAVLWIHYPQLKPHYVIAGLTVGLALIATNFHFLSDVVAGTFVGVSSGWMITAIWSAGGAVNRQPK
jgi:membrane-associated phospholipid phosphatase